MPDDKKTPLEEAVEEAIDQAVELLVYAPIGLVLLAREQLPALIERGRQQVTSQATMAKMMGQFAVKEGEKTVRSRIERLAEKLTPPAFAPAPGATEAAAAAASGAATPGPSSSNGKASPEPATAEPKPTSEHLAIPGYDTLAASQVVQRLAGLSGTELEAVRAYEDSTRGRRTILTKIAALQAEHG